MTYQIIEWVTAIYDEWTSDKSEHANRAYIAGTSEYLICHSHLLRISYIKCDTEISNNSNTDIDKSIAQICYHVYKVNHFHPRKW